MKKQHKPRRITINVDCPCGMIHKVSLGLGELQTLERAIIRGKLSNFNADIKTMLQQAERLGTKNLNIYCLIVKQKM